MKYAAKSAAKNISSLASHTIVPTLTIEGRFGWPWKRAVGSTVAVATCAIMSVDPRRLRAAPGARGSGRRRRAG
ncbi:hypothetical protein GCM10009872_25310 [Actinopolymorpha rutila]